MSNITIMSGCPEPKVEKIKSEILPRFLTPILMSLLPYDTETNCKVGTDQVLIWRVAGGEIGRSINGVQTMTPLFVKLVSEQLGQLYGYAEPSDSVIVSNDAKEL